MALTLFISIEKRSNKKSINTERPYSDTEATDFFFCFIVAKKSKLGPYHKILQLFL